MTRWTCACVLDSSGTLIEGSHDALADALRRGADLRIQTEFIHNQHIDVNSNSAERIREVAEFALTYLVDDRWAAGIMTRRHAIRRFVG